MSHSSDFSDDQLIQACLSHDRKAQQSLFQRYEGAMYSSCFRILNDHQLAEDALLEAFMEVFRDLASFRNRSSLGAWIKTIVVRKAILRKKQELRFINEAIPAQSLITWPNDLSGEYLDQALAQLSSGYRTVFTLVEIEGYTHRETAELLGIQEGTSKSQLFHAKRQLRQTLKALNA